MDIENQEIGPECSLEELVQSMDCHLRRTASTSTVEENSNTSSPNSTIDIDQRTNLDSATWSSTVPSNRFSKSMGDLSNLRSQQLHRRSVTFENDLAEHTEMITRARNRFHQLELKYPEIFKNSTRSSSVSSLAHTKKKWKSLDHGESQLFNGVASDSRPTEAEHNQDNQRHATIATGMKERTLSVPVNGIQGLGSKASCFRYCRRPPPLSMAMRSQHLEDSCDSAFDEHEVESTGNSHDQDINSTTVRSPSGSKYGRFLYPCDSLESDKDSGISTDRPFVPSARNRRNSRPVRWADSEESTTSYDNHNGLKSTSTSTLPRGGSLNLDEPQHSARTKNSSDRRGILKSAAYRNQEIKTGGIDSGDEGTACYRRRQAFLKGQHSGGYCQSLPRYLNCDDTDSEAETVCSIRSEVVLRPKSAREHYMSLYQPNASQSLSQDSNYKHERVYKSRSMPELSVESSVFSETAANVDIVTNCENKRYKKKQKFGRRSGLYIVNDFPVSEKPRLQSNSSKKGSTFSKKKLKRHSVHITEHTKKWYDNCTAVSKPTAGQSLGKIIGVSHDYGGMAYQMELNRPGNGLYGFFIQKGYKQYRRGVFISRIMDSVSAKFLAGLLSPGDEILEINGLSAQTRAISEVHDIMAHSDKLVLTVLPFLGRKDW